MPPTTDFVHGNTSPVWATGEGMELSESGKTSRQIMRGLLQRFAAEDGNPLEKEAICMAGSAA